MYNIGTDIVEVNRIRELINIYDMRFLNRVFSKKEIIYCLSKNNPSIHFAGRFSAKEAIRKAISKKHMDSFFSFKELSIENDNIGRPFLSHPTLNTDYIDVSISHTKSYAISFAVLRAEW